ncbi:YwgA family protein [Heyndrickxia ginsengihumi]|uniref:YwgA family protein n=1 Tax=Heyndrickxia ginsengihumi TaxID=363870 RepID=A0A0A6VEP9_9BACI|nr:hypothetical protein [Heyndrickxia ginsengihumi]KHD86735.1 hypothetical protein NG54_01340 [Heyndrickxia ginsengihumi]MBE6183995.1 YwgA family protein [Bacillus sp. (in: firmicutes)]MCM3022204.1 YwgA family protein [Heyndrickxia ginsengihumi]NEY18436.1 YwgA family protein [Heyndrickxia ginsengihumi]
MLEDHVKLIGALAASGEVIGRKKLQKMIYIAKKLSFPFQEKFHFHFYGPYSEELTLKIEELTNLGFVQEVKEKKGGYMQYRYSITKDGNEFLQMYEQSMAGLKDCLVNMNQQNARFLELTSTVMYFYHLPKEEVKEKIFTLKAKQRYTEDEIEQAYRYIEELQELAKRAI